MRTGGAGAARAAERPAPRAPRDRRVSLAHQRVRYLSPTQYKKMKVNKLRCLFRNWITVANDIFHFYCGHVLRDPTRACCMIYILPLLRPFD